MVVAGILEIINYGGVEMSLNGVGANLIDEVIEVERNGNRIIKYTGIRRNYI